MISAEHLLLISIWWMLNSSTLSMITSGSSWGFLMTRPSLSKKTISSSSFLGIFIGRSHEWTLFIFLSWPFSRTSSFYMSPILLRSSLFLLQEVCYLLLLDLCLYRPSVGICRASFSRHTFITSLTKLKSPPGISNVYTCQCDVHGLGGIYSTCCCLFFLLEY